MAVNDAIKLTKPVCKALETTREITKLIKHSPRRDGIFRELKREHDHNSEFQSPGMRLLCPTRWTVQADSLKSVIDNYVSLMDTWEEALHIVRDMEMKARIDGIVFQMQTFEFAFGTVLGELILRHSDNLSRTIQAKSTSAAEAQLIAKLGIATIQKIREESQYDLFWDKLLTFSDMMDISPLQLPWRRKKPARFEDGSGSSGHYPESTKKFYRQLYYEALDNTVNCLIQRFDQPGYKIYSNLEQLLIKAGKQQEFEEEFQVVIDFY